MTNYGSSQQTASTISELKKSYNKLFQGWLGEHRNVGQVRQLLDVLEVTSGNFLDVACGLGYSLDMAEKSGTIAFGIDISDIALAKSKKENPLRRVVIGDGENLPWSSDTFDYVTCLGSLEHFIEPSFGAQEISRVLKPHGKAAIMLPNSHHLMAIYNVYKTGGILPELQNFERFGTFLEWKTLLEGNGLSVSSVHKFNIGFARIFKKDREGFWYLYNILFKLLGDWWIPLNLSFALTYVCKKVKTGSTQDGYST